MGFNQKLGFMYGRVFVFGSVRLEINCYFIQYSEFVIIKKVMSIESNVMLTKQLLTPPGL